MSGSKLRQWQVCGALNLGRTLRQLSLWGAAPWLRVDRTGGWYARRTEDGPGTVRVWMEGPSTLCAQAWGPGAERVIAQAPRLAGLHDDPSTFVTEDPRLVPLVKRARGVRMAATDHIFPALVATVLAQKVTGQESAAATNRMAWQLGDRAPGPRDNLWLLPSPRTVRDTPYWAMHPLGIDRRRAMVIIEVARRAKRLEESVGMPYAQASARLQVLHGIGPWTAGVILGSVLGDPDAVPVGDYHLPNVVAWNLAGEPRADDARMLELLAPFEGHRGRVVRLFKGAGTAPPKWGPRSTPRDIRGM